MKRAVFHYKIEEVAPFIDWSYFFHAWGLCNNCKCDTAMQDVRQDAEAILKEIGNRYRTHALFALCEARGSDDDIIIEGTKLPLLRQQHNRSGCPNLCLSDFISPQSDKIGLFATCTDTMFGSEFSNDVYKNIIVQILADRLAEATATLLHRQVRTSKELWGYAPNESLTIEELHLEKNQGIRPAVGYPSLPDQSVIFIIDSLLETKEIGIELSPNGAMHPHAAVCGLMLSHPAAHYFSVGKISHEQLQDYASRRSMSAEKVQKFLTKNIE